MKILVTGSTGLVGSATAQLFKEKGWEVIGLDNDQRHKLFGTKSQDVADANIDIRDEGAVDELFRKHKFDAIVHAAGQPSHDWSKDHPVVDFYINTVGTLNLLEATHHYCPKATFVFVSTDKIYGEGMTPILLEELDTRFNDKFLGQKGFNEETPIKPVWSPFGAGKLAADQYVQEYGHQYGIKTVCFRPGCITGKQHEGTELHGFLAYLSKCIKEGKTYKIYGFKGKQVRDQIHANDLASAFFEFVGNPRIAAVYNIGGGPERSTSVLEAGEMIANELGKEFKYELHEARSADRIWDVHDVGKFRKDYPEWDYQYSLQDIIKDVAHGI